MTIPIMKLRMKSIICTHTTTLGKDSKRQCFCGKRNIRADAMNANRSRRHVAIVWPTLLSVGLAGGSDLEKSGARAATSPDLPSTSSDKTVLVVGASGKSGCQVVKSLLDRGFRVKAGVRNIERALQIESVKEGEQSYLQIGELAKDYDGDKLNLVSCDVTKGTVYLHDVVEGCDYIVCATGFRPSLNTLFNGKDTSLQVDNLGTKNLVDAALANTTKVKGFVLISSLLTNARAVGEEQNPNFVFLNLLGGVLDAKKAGEDYLRSSEIPYVIVRPGGLSDQPASELGGLILQEEDTLFGKDTDPGRVISREEVGEVCAEAIIGFEKKTMKSRIVEIVQSVNTKVTKPEEWFL